MSELAIFGGNKVRNKPFPEYRTIGEEEKNIINKVIEDGKLSQFLGCWHDDFYGGEQVKKLEKEWATYFGVKYAISVNSATSGLYCAIGATGVGPGDEVIVSPYTMSASATAPLIFNALPIFADIEEDYYCLDPNDIQDKITENTKAIVVVDIFGQPYDVDEINKIAKKHGLIVIEDAAQAPGAKYKDKFAGTLGDIGVFSLNYHKHIHSGEGGIVVTNDSKLAERIYLVRNHAEAVCEAKNVCDFVNLIGFNFRMTEIEAAIASCQLRKLEDLLEQRLSNIEYINKGFNKFNFIETPKIRKNSKHSFYVQPLKYRENEIGIPRNVFINAVKAELEYTEGRKTEGVKIGCGYVKPLYLQPIFQQKIAYGNNGCPFNCHLVSRKVEYSKGDCPVCENMHFSDLITHELFTPGMTKNDMDDVLYAFEKVYKNKKELEN